MIAENLHSQWNIQRRLQNLLLYRWLVLPISLEKLVTITQTAQTFAPAEEPHAGTRSLQPDSKMQLCGFDIYAVKTSGHTKGALSYIVHGLDLPVALIGDALFSLSIGGAKCAYQLALKNNREQLLSLPFETILCPGHGPMTSVIEERAHNPFF